MRTLLLLPLILALGGCTTSATYTRTDPDGTRHEIRTPARFMVDARSDRMDFSLDDDGLKLKSRGMVTDAEEVAPIVKGAVEGAVRGMKP